MDNKNYDCPYIISPFYQTSTLKKKVVFSFSTCFNLPINLKSIKETIESKKKNKTILSAIFSPIIIIIIPVIILWLGRIRNKKSLLFPSSANNTVNAYSSLTLLSTAFCRISSFPFCQQKSVSWLGMKSRQIGWQWYINVALHSKIFYSFNDTWSFKLYTAGDWVG